MWTSDADLPSTREPALPADQPLPDTGSLRDDVLAFTDAKATLIATADARAHFLSALVRQPGARNTCHSDRVLGRRAAGEMARFRAQKAWRVA